MKALLLAALVAAFSLPAFAASEPESKAPVCISVADATHNLASNGDAVLGVTTIRWSGRTLLVAVIKGHAFGALVANGCITLDPFGRPVIIDLGTYQPNRDS